MDSERRDDDGSFEESAIFAVLQTSEDSMNVQSHPESLSSQPLAMSAATMPDILQRSEVENRAYSYFSDGNLPNTVEGLHNYPLESSLPFGTTLDSISTPSSESGATNVENDNFGITLTGCDDVIFMEFSGSSSCYTLGKIEFDEEMVNLKDDSREGQRTSGQSDPNVNL